MPRPNEPKKTAARRLALGGLVCLLLSPLPSMADDVAFLGVQTLEETEHSEGGARVVQVVVGSPAADAGIEEGDVIVRFDSAVIRGPLALTEKIHGSSPGDKVTLRLLRDRKSKDVQVEMGDRFGPLRFFSAPMVSPGQSYSHTFPEGESRSFNVLPRTFSGLYDDRPLLGVQLVDTTPELRAHLGGDEDSGVLVSKVLRGMPAERAGVAVGDLILSVGGKAVGSSDDLVQALRGRQGETFSLELIRDGRKKSIEVTIPEPDNDRPSGPRA